MLQIRTLMRRIKRKSIILMSKSKGHIPIRTCVSCRTKMAKQDLVRLVLNGKNQMVIDSNGKGTGRGIYTCHEESCMKKVSAHRTLNRLFRVDRPVSVGFQI